MTLDKAIEECGYIPLYDNAIDDLFYSCYCPNCGAKMEV